MEKKSGLHPRNKHKHGYDFNQLIKVYPSLSSFVIKSNPKTKYKNDTIDFANSKAVLALNTALLLSHYELNYWTIPEGYLCPPIPSRADYIHHIADLLKTPDGKIPTGEKIHLLDIGTGANCIYPLIAHQEFGWKITGSDIDEVALKNAQTIVDENKLSSSITLIKQTDAKKIFSNIIKPDDFFHLTICNPPFHSSAKEAAEATLRKNKNLGLAKFNQNFGGQNAELWCEGGEKEFILKMINESREFKKNVLWFSSLVSKVETMPLLYQEFKELGITKIKTLDMAQGQKKSRIIAWSF